MAQCVCALRQFRKDVLKILRSDGVIAHPKKDRMMTTSPDAPDDFWIMKRTSEAWYQWSDLRDERLDIGLMNERELRADFFVERENKRGLKPPFFDDLWLSDPEHLPHLLLPTSFHPHYFDPQGYHLVSPRLFELLDQPRGTLQGLPVSIEWLGDDKPDRTYVWLSFIPAHPAVDLERSTGEIKEYVVSPDQPPVRHLSYPDIIRLRQGLTSPYGVFRATEQRGTVVVADAVAEAVVRAGCTGIEFNEAETSRAVEGPRRRRGVGGAEPHPRTFQRKQ